MPTWHLARREAGCFIRQEAALTTIDRFDWVTNDQDTHIHCVCVCSLTTHHAASSLLPIFGL